MPVERPREAMDTEEKVYVAVGKVVKESKSVLMWALENSSTRTKICIILVYQPSNHIPLFGGIQDEEAAHKHQEKERHSAHNILDEYITICQNMGFNAQKLLIENESVVKGILQTIANFGVRKLVMGAASDKSYSRNMMQIGSPKAVSVRLQAPVACQICFVCKGRLIHIREGIAELGEYLRTFGQPPSLNPSCQQQPTNLSKSRSAVHSQSSDFLHLAIPALESLSDVNGYCYRGGELSVSTATRTGKCFCVPSTPKDESNEFDEHESSPHSTTLSRSSSGGISTSSSSASNNGILKFVLQRSQLMSSPHGDQPKRATGDEPIPRRESLDEAVRCAKAEKEAFEDFISLKRDALDEAFHRAKADLVAAKAIERVKRLENLLSEEQNLKMKTEEALTNEKAELAKALEQKHQLENQIAETDQKVKELEHKIISDVEVLQHCKKERDEAEIERDNVVREAEDLKKSISEQASSSTSREREAANSHFFPGFTDSEIEQATNNYQESAKIGEGGFGSIYRAELRCTQVAIKLLNPNGLQGPSEFHKEVEILSKVRHPNLVTLIGACPESCALIYEYLPNGSLEDRLNCRDNSQPLSWRIRLRIAAEVCCVLMFLQSCKPGSIVHGDVKPSNILLDANFVSKLSDFGIARMLEYKEGYTGTTNRTLILRTDPKGTPPYIDPEFFSTGILTSKSDVYSFGVVLLRLLTGRPAVGLVAEVHCARNDGKLKEILDPLAGEWPLQRAVQLVKLALRCCGKDRQTRPDLAVEVWGVLNLFLFFGRQRVIKLLQSN